MSDDRGYRARLGIRQAELLSALVRPDCERELRGFDGERVRTAAASLRSKRVRAIAKAWPRLTLALGPDFVGELTRYIREHPSGPADGPLGDGRALARALDARGRLPWEARLELLAMELRWRWSGNGRRRPRRFGTGLAFGRPFRVAVAVRAPAVGERWLVIAR